MPRAWDNWYHCNGNTYGTWLHGDPRGFRERRHRRHVEGDYKNPPPAGAYDRLHAHARKIMAGEPIHLNIRQRRSACHAMVGELHANGIEIIALGVDDHHFHVLARFPDHRPKHWIGLAKRRASLMLQGDKSHARLWALGSRAEPVRDRAHQLNVFNYIVRHAKRGAFVWTFRDPKPELEVIRGVRYYSL